MKLSNKVKLFISFLCVMLAGCNAEYAGPPAIVGKGILIKDLAFENQYLGECIRDIANRAHAEYANQIEKIDCLGGSNPNESLQALVKSPPLDKRRISTRANELSEFVSLKSLTLSGVWISDLNFSRLTQLESLTLGEGIARNIDLSKNSMLKNLYISCNPLLNVQLPRGGILESLSIDGSYCQLPALLAERSTVFFTENPEFIDTITGAPLNEFSFTQSPTGILDLSEQHKLTKVGISLFSFSQISAIPENVTSLGIGATNLTHLDIRQCKTMKNLDVRSNNLTSIIFPNDAAINELLLSDNDLDDQALAALTTFTNLTTLQVLNNKRLKKIINNANITGLWVSGNHSTDEFEGLKSLDTLSISDGELTGSDFTKLTALKLLNLVNVILASKKPSLLLGDNLDLVEINGYPQSELEIQGGRFLRQFNMSAAEVTSLDLRALQNLKRLELRDTKLTKGHLAIPESLENLTLADLTWDEFKIEGTTNLTALALENSSLARLDLTMLPSLTSLYIYSSKLKELDLTSANPMFEVINIGDISSLAVLKAHDLPGLRYFLFEGEYLNATVKAAIKRLIAGEF